MPTHVELIRLARELRVSNALAAYKAAQRQQGKEVARHNAMLASEVAAHNLAAEGGNIPAVLASRARNIRSDVSVSLSGAAVFDAAAELIDALDAAGFGDRDDVKGA